MKHSLLLVLSVSLAACISDKGIDDDEPSSSSSNSSEPSDNPDVDTDEPDAVPTPALVPVAIGFEYSGMWDEATNSLQPYLFPDLNNTNGGEPIWNIPRVTITLASIEYFSLGAEATEEDRAMESCTFVAYYFDEPGNLYAEQYDWENAYGNGLNGTPAGTGESVALWQSFEGNLMILEGTQSDRCGELSDGYSVGMFDNIRLGLGFGPLSNYMTTAYSESDSWDAEAEASYHTQYIAINHPSDTDLGYNFVAYDWTSAIFVEADPTTCVEAGEYEEGSLADEALNGAEEVCGLIMTETTDDGTMYDLGDHSLNVGSRYGYVQGNAWWYEDFPNLDLNLLASYPED